MKHSCPLPEPESAPRRPLTSARPTLLHRWSFLIVLALWLAGLLSPRESGAEPVDARSRVTVTTANTKSTLDRVSGRITSTVDVTLENAGDRLLEAPLHAAVHFTAQSGTLADLTVTGAAGGLGQGPYGMFFFDLTPQIAAGLAPGAKVTFNLQFSPAKNARVSFDVRPFATVNQDPMVNAGGPYTAQAGQEIPFDASGSSDPEGGALTFQWNFGDGTPPGAGATVAHAFATAGAFEVILKVTDAKGAEKLVRIPVTVTPAEPFALARVRVLDGAGLPLGGATIQETLLAGPERQLASNGSSGFASLGGGAGNYRWKFSKAGHLDVWRTKTLSLGQVGFIPNPWLAEISPNPIRVSPLVDGVVSSPRVALAFSAGAFVQPSDVTLTELNTQSLPFPLPAGWSPLAQFHAGFSVEPIRSGSAKLTLPASLVASTPVVWVKYAPGMFRWETLELLEAPGGPNVSAAIASSGWYALVVPDLGAAAPPQAVAGQPLPESTSPLVTDGFAASGAVTPAVAAASLDAEKVIASAVVNFAHLNSPPSGVVFQTRISESYELSDGTKTRTPDYDTTIFAYQRPAGLRAEFPLRPQVLFGPSELKEALVRVDVMEGSAYAGAVFGNSGGQLSKDGVRVVAPPGAIAAPQAAELAIYDVQSLSGVGGAPAIAKAFSLSVNDLEGGARFGFFFEALVPNTHYVLGRIVTDDEGLGITPLERFLSDANGVLASIEPATGVRLPGVTGPGDYALVQVAGLQAIVQGIARDTTGQPAAGLAIRTASQPWLVFSANDGSYITLGATGPGLIAVVDPRDGNAGSTAIDVVNPGAPQTADLTTAPTGPRVASTSPAANALNVRAVEPIVVRFTEPISPGSLGGAGVRLRDSVANADVPAAMSLDVSNRILTLFPTNPLAAGTAHEIIVNAGIRDLQNLPIEGPLSFSFTTVPPEARPAGAQLVVYEPGAQNIPAGVLDQLVGYVPGAGSSHVVAEGSAGTADPITPVLLVNENNGQTATVLSNADGSFANFINAEAEDFIAAIFVNANGTRIRVAATRQLFDDGRVGLYQGGGILEAESDGGPVRVFIEPEAIETRNVFKVESLGLQELLVALQGTVPEGAKLLGGLKVKIDGDQVAPNAEANISVPLDPATLNLQPGQTAEDGAFALAITRVVDGERVFQVVDRLKFREGRIESNTLPFLGFLAALAAEEVAFAGLEVVLSMLYIGDQNIIVTGKALQTVPNATGALVQRPLPGAFVTAQKASVASARQGRLQTGQVYATTGADGVYSLVLPENIADPIFNTNQNYTLVATHPRFVGRVAEPVALSINEPVIERDLVFTTPVGGFSRFGPPRISISRLPRFPALDVPATLKVVARHGAKAPDIFVAVESVASRVAGVIVNPTDVSVTAGQEVVIGKERTKFFTIQSSKALDATFRVRALADSGGEVFQSEEREFARFGGSPTVGTNALTSSDPNDTVGPAVIATFPTRGGTLGPGEKFTVVFNEPIDTSVTTEPNAVTITPAPIGLPGLRLSADQTTLEIAPGGLVPGTDYTLTVSSAVKDIANPPNPLDQEPGVSGPQTFSVTFRGAQIATTELAGINNGGGAVIHNNAIYALDRGTGTGELVVYELSTLLGASTGLPAAPAKRLPLIGVPRDLVVIPQWSFKRNLNSATVETKDLLAVVGGTAGTSSVDESGNITLHPQFLRIFDISDPVNPTLLLGAVISRRPNLITKVSWHPPFLAYLENGADSQEIGLIDLQEMLVGFKATDLELATFGEAVPGKDLTDDGDYVDAGETLPIPPREPTQFFGKVSSFTLGATTQQIQDFNYERAFNYIAVTLSGGQKIGPSGPTGPVLPPSYQIIEFGATEMVPPAGRLQFAANARPKRVATIFGQEMQFAAQSENRNIALVSLSPDGDGVNKLAVIDITQPTGPTLIGTPIVFPPELGVLQSAVLREDGLVALATTRDLILLNPKLLALPAVAAGPGGTAPLHPSVVAILPGAGSGNRTIGTTVSGLNAVVLGGRNELVRAAPLLRFVSLPGRVSLLDPSAIVDDVSAVNSALDQMRIAEHLAPARLRAAGGAVASLVPPSPVVHYHVLIEAPGGAGSSFRVSLESLDRSGYPLKNKGRFFAPVRAMSEPALDLLKQKPRVNCDAAIKTVKAHRLSSDKNHPHYNLYVTDPFALTYERISSADLDSLTAQPKRAILWSGFYLRAGIDPDESMNSAVGPFATIVDTAERVTRANAAVLALTLPANYVMGPNPAPIGGDVSIPATFGTVNAANGEFRHDTVDLALPSRRMPIVFERAICAQDLHEGPFGRGWDSMHLQHLTELKPEVFPPGSVKPLVLRADVAKSVISSAGDVEFNTGGGHVILFRNKGSTAPEEFTMDPLISELGWAVEGGTYFLPDPQEKGVFDLLYRFRSGEFARLTPDGTQYRYSSQGRLERVIDRYPKNFHVLEYNERGELRRIVDKSVTSDRFLELGYYRLDADSLFTADLDERTDKIFKAGKIARIRDYAGRDVRYEYSDDGILLLRKGPEVAAANGEFRAVTKYQWSDDVSGNAQGVIAGNDAAQANGGGNGGTPLFSVNAPANANGTPVATGGIGAGGNVAINVSATNSAATVGTQTTSSVGPDGSNTEFKFDDFGYPAEIKATGALAGAATHIPKYNEVGLLESMTFPEGNKTTYTYDVQNKALRSRANLLQIKMEPGARGGSPSPLESTFAYDGRYNLMSGVHKDFNGKTVTYSLRGDGRDVQTITYGQAGTQSYSQNDNGQLENETTPEGIKIVTSYVADSGFRDKVVRGGDMETGFGYNSTIAGELGVPTSVDLPRGDDIDILEYDSRLLLVRMVRGSLFEKRSYDENGNLRTIERSVGGSDVYREEREYSQISFLKKLKVLGVETDGAGSAPLETEFNPDAAQRIGSIKLPSGRTRSYTYDHLGNMVSMRIGPEGGGYSEQYNRDLHGNLREVRTNGELVREMRYDGYDRLINSSTKTGGADEVVSFEYFGNGERKKTTVSGPNGDTVLEMTVGDVDELGRPMSETTSGDQATGTRTFGYLVQNGLTTTVTGPRDVVVSKTDSAGRQVGFKNGWMDATFGPDKNGNIESILSAEGTNGTVYKTTFTYDGLDHRLTNGDDLGNRFTFSPRTDGNVTSIKDARDFSTGQEFTVLGELKKRIRPEQIASSYTYDADRLPKSVKDSADKGNSFTYNDTLRLSELSFRDASTTKLETPDKRNLPQSLTIPGGSITAAFDLPGRIASQDLSYNAGTDYKLSGAKYDALNRLREVKYGIGGTYTAKFGFDKLGPMTSAMFDEPGGPFALSTTIDSDGSRKSLVYPSPITVFDDRENSGRLQKVRSTPGGEIWNATTFAGAELPQEITHAGGAIRETNTYDLRRRLLARRYERGTTVLADVRYQYDAADNQTGRQFVHRHGRADFFTYDSANRLTRAELGARPIVSGSANRAADGLQGGAGLAPGFFAREYTYNPSGLDHLKSSALANPEGLPIQGQPTAILSGPVVPAFAGLWDGHDGMLHAQTIDSFNRGASDPLGNVKRSIVLTRRSGDADPVPRVADFTYNALNHLTKILIPVDGIEIQYEYQPSGLMHHRVVRQGGAITAENAFVWHENRLIEEYDLVGNSASLRARYFYADEDAPVAVEIQQPSGTPKRFHYLRDAQLSVLAVADDSGVVHERMSYDAWGQPMIEKQDLLGPRLAAIHLAANGDLLIQFSETVMPTLTGAGAGSAFVTSAGPITGAITVISGGTAISGQLIYDEAISGFPFGTVIRFKPSAALPDSLSVTANEGALVDSWGNGNEGETRGFTLSGVQGTLLFQGVAEGSTGPERVARSSIGSPILFHGQFYDFDAGLCYMRARFYDPYTGQFLQQDSEQYEDSVNHYAGLGNNPVTFRDPEGRGVWTRLARLFFGGSAEKAVREGLETTVERGVKRGAPRAAPAAQAASQGRHGSTSALNSPGGPAAAGSPGAAPGFRPKMTVDPVKSTVAHKKPDVNALYDNGAGDKRKNLIIELIDDDDMAPELNALRLVLARGQASYARIQAKSAVFASSKVDDLAQFAGQFDDVTIVAHGNTTRLGGFSPAELARMIKSSGIQARNWEVIACKAGKEADGFAQEFANALGRRVDAHRHSVFINSRGHVMVKVKNELGEIEDVVRSIPENFRPR